MDALVSRPSPRTFVLAAPDAEAWTNHSTASPLRVDAPYTDQYEFDEERRRAQQHQRTRERVSRQRRTLKLTAMRDHVQTLEVAMLSLRLLPDDDAIWDEFLTDDTKRMRAMLRRLTPAAREATELTRSNAHLRRLLREHALFRRVVAASVVATGSVQEPMTKDWSNAFAPRRFLARLNFRPWTRAACVRELAAAADDAAQFNASDDWQSTGLSVLGWRDSRRHDTATSSFQFSLHKTFRGFDLARHTAMSWRVYTETELYTSVVHNGRANVAVDVLQELSPTMAIVHYQEQYQGMDATVHCLYLLALVETPDGGMLYMRSIASPEMQHAISGPRDVWASNFFWTHWYVLDDTKPRESTDYTTSIVGSIKGADASYVAMWLFESLGTIIRAEAVCTGRQRLDF